MKLYQTVLTACLAGSAITAQAADKSPNIVLILLDDAGYSDFGCYGSEIPTPNIDRLASQGVRLRHFYNQARSAPTRASMMTGLYPHQVGNGSLGKVKGQPNYQGYPNDRNIFIPELLNTVGYHTIVTGKWHLGFPQGVTPTTRGFDSSLNAPFGAYYFQNDYSQKANGKKLRENNLYLNGEGIEFDDERLPKNWYSTHMWTEYGLKFVDEAIEKDEPFFWYLAHNAAHFPLQAPQETIDKHIGKYMGGWDSLRDVRIENQVRLGLFDKKGRLSPNNPKIPAWNSLSLEDKKRYDMQMAIFAAVVEEIDNSVGNLVKHLEEKGELDNTIIMLLSDNGGNGEPGVEGVFKGNNPGSAESKIFLGAAWANACNTPFYLYKHHGHEGGCNTPLIISYPDGIKPEMKGKILHNAYGHVVDIMPTLAELSGAEYPTHHRGHKLLPMEGRSLLPLLQGEGVDQTRPVIMEHEGNKMYRLGKWKIVQEYTQPMWRLYDLEKDPTELVNLAQKYPDVLKSMVDGYKEMSKRTGVVDGLKFKVGSWYTPVSKYKK